MVVRGYRYQVVKFCHVSCCREVPNTQRFTDVFTTYGILPGGGISIEKIPLGVTAHQIEHVDDPTVSTAAHPVYTLLNRGKLTMFIVIYLIDDGLTAD